MKIKQKSSQTIRTPTNETKIDELHTRCCVNAAAAIDRRLMKLRVGEETDLTLSCQTNLLEFNKVLDLINHGQD